MRGSVKDISIYSKPNYKTLGGADVDYTHRYSVLDLKKMPDEIPGREAICAIAAYNFELLENSGVNTHYLGVVNPDGKVVTLDQMQEAPTRMRIKLVNIFEPHVRIIDGRLVFSYALFEDNRDNLNNFVTPIEWIYRNGLPQGSSVLRELSKAQERGDAAYIDRVLQRLGFTEIPQPNTMLPRPYGNYTTKYEPLGDRALGDDYDVAEAIATNDYSLSEALKISALTGDQFVQMIDRRNKVATIIKERGEEVGIIDWDGKLELAWSYGPMVVDVAGSPDENRWFYNGQQVSKEILRQFYDTIQPELRKDIARAQNRAAEEAVATGRLPDWRQYLQVQPVSIATASPYLIPLMGEMHQALANQWTGIHFYNARPLDTVMKDLSAVIDQVKEKYAR